MPQNTAIAERINAMKSMNHRHSNSDSNKNLKLDKNNSRGNTHNSSISNENDSITVHTRDEKSNIVFRFSNANISENNKSNSSQYQTSAHHESDSIATNDFLYKYLQQMDRKAIGVWSIIGKPFHPRGDPDLNLIKNAKKEREQRKMRMKRKTYKSKSNSNSNNNTMNSNPSQISSSDLKARASHSWGGGTIHMQSQPRMAVIDMHQTITATSFGGTQRATTARQKILELEKYTFPARFVLESDMRSMQAQNGVPLANIIEHQTSDTGPLFEPLKFVADIVTNNNTNINVSNSTSEIKKDNNTKTKRYSFSQNSNRATSLYLQSSTNYEYEFNAGQNKNLIEKWMTAFSNTREQQRNLLYEKLCEAKYDRLECYQSPELLSIALDIICNPYKYESKKGRKSSKKRKQSIWTTAIEIQKKELKKNMKKEHLLFVKYFGNKAIGKANKNGDREIEEEENEDEKNRKLEIQRARTFYRKLLTFVEKEFGSTVECIHDEDFKDGDINEQKKNKRKRKRNRNNSKKNEICIGKDLLFALLLMKNMLENGCIADGELFFQFILNLYKLREQHSKQNMNINLNTILEENESQVITNSLQSTSSVDKKQQLLLLFLFLKTYFDICESDLNSFIHRVQYSTFSLFFHILSSFSFSF